MQVLVWLINSTFLSAPVAIKGIGRKLCLVA